MVLLSSDGVVQHVPTMARDVYDVVGAGDTVTAYLALILAAGGSVTEAAIVANFAAQPLLALHWFNPIAWLGWRAMRRDQEAAIVANFAAGVEVGKPGAATVSPGEVTDAYDAYMDATA